MFRRLAKSVHGERAYMHLLIDCVTYMLSILVPNTAFSIELAILLIMQQMLVKIGYGVKFY